MEENTTVTENQELEEDTYSEGDTTPEDMETLVATELEATTTTEE